MAKIPFNVQAYTARLIGRENVSTLNGAILELVKNTYDADASICIIYFDSNSYDLYLIDNGDGMTKDIIINNWMTIGKSTKKKKYLSKSGRIQTGAKGIGRFALDRIADKCEMLTIHEDARLLWKVDWRDFDFDGNITQVTADLEESNIKVEQFIKGISNDEVKEFIEQKISNTGTLFKLSLLRDVWDESRIESIKKNLRTLIPAEISNIFKIYVFDNISNFCEAEVLVNQDDYDYDYKINFESKDDIINIEILRNEFDFKERFDEIIKNAGFRDEDILYFQGKPILYKLKVEDLLPTKKDFVYPKVGNYSGVFYFSKKTSTKKDAEKYFYKSSAYNFDESFGGIKIYRDSFRVRPYGEVKSSSYDWLLLSNRKTKSPAGISHPSGAWKVSADQLTGSLFISRTNISLPDQANREGIVETNEFVLLKEILKSIISLFEKDRQYVFRLLNAYHEKLTKSARLQEEIRKKAEEDLEKSKNENKIKTDSNNDLILDDLELNKVNAVDAQIVIDEKDEQIKFLEDENKLLRALATTGIVTNTYIHEFKAKTHELNMKIINAKEAIEFDSNMDEALENIKKADEIRQSFSSWFSITIDSIRRDKRRRKVMLLAETLHRLSLIWENVLSTKNINIKIICEDNNINLKGFPFEIETILSNLITNSVSSFDSTFHEGEKEITIKLYYEDKYVVFEYTDNGNGLTGVYKNNPDKILEQFETNKRDQNGEADGTGMGMWIVNNIVKDYGGEIDLSKNKVIKNGFWVKIKLR